MRNLIHHNDAKPCVIVTGYDNESFGVYPNEDRAMEYIRDFCRADDNTLLDIKTEQVSNDIHVYVAGSTNDGPDFTISPSFYRD